MIRHHVLMGTLLGGALALAATAGCGRIAVWAAPEKTASTERTPAALEADKVFWSTLHSGAYDRIPETLTALKAAYLANPAMLKVYGEGFTAVACSVDVDVLGRAYRQLLDALR